MSQNLSDDEDMVSSPSSPATPVNATANPHLPAHLDLKTPPQSQDNTPYASRIGPTSFPAGGASSATLQTSTSSASVTFQDLDGNDLAASGSVSTGGRRRQSNLAALGGNNGVSVMPSSEQGVPMWLTKRGLEEIHNVEERLLDRQFSTHMYGSIFNDKDMNIAK